eukprot:TRINITY_DN11597_c0_g1_i1.p1 TRINITY_DN11597_c0_g1~~TRINITY_DN11597_c0_g1_i1.p1  ORF type:complete len:153 (+),score=18.90 TRINITY_DN11597_c0_g1_i1:72-530(+)
MLDFYGLLLVDLHTGEVKRNPENWKSRYQNLDYNGHNNLRMSRIIMSLGELGFVRYKEPLVNHWKNEILNNNLLQSCKSSLLRFWEPLTHHDTPEYIKKTGETDEDREPSIFFHHLEHNTPEMSRILTELESYGNQNKSTFENDDDEVIEIH